MERTLRKLAWTIGIGLGAYAALALLIDAYVGLSQPELQSGAREGVLVTTDAEGRRHETRLAVVEDGDTLWIQSGHHFRGWYQRLALHPEVELIRSGERRAYTAVPVETPEARAHLVELLKAHAGTLRFHLIRAILLFAEIKPVRLDPR
jgi:hypothetical protein